MTRELYLIVIMMFVGVSGAAPYPIGENYSVDTILIPSADTRVDEIISDDNGTTTAMSTKFLGGNGGTVILICENTCEGVANLYSTTQRDASACNFSIYDARILLDALILGVLEGFLYPDFMDIASTVEGANVSYAMTEEPYFGWVCVVPIEMETGQNSNTFGSLGRVAEQENEETLKGYIGFINGHDFILVVSTEPVSVFRTIVSNLKVVSRDEKGQAVLDDIMTSL